MDEELADALHAAVDGDFLLDCKGGESVALRYAGVSDVVWWAVHATSDWLAAHDARVRAEALAPIEVVCAECRDRAAMEPKG